MNRRVQPAPEPINRNVWPLLGEELPTPPGRSRDPYLEQGCHPDIVARIWDELGAELVPDCRAQAKGRPVLAHPAGGRIFAFARGTAYALWLAPPDRAAARDAGLSSEMTWGGGGITDLAQAGPGWVWGRWEADELQWLQHAFAALGGCK